MAEALPAVHPLAQPGAYRWQPSGAVSGGLAADIVARTDQLATDRAGWEAEWRQLADYCLPTASRGMSLTGSVRPAYDNMIQGSSTKDASRKRFDSTAMTAIDRLSAGMESLVTPQSEKWHGLGVDDPLAPEPTDEESQWFERVRDKLFAVRYEADAGFITANQKAIRSAVTFGTAVVFLEEAFGAQTKDQRALPIFYRHIPLSQSLIAVNAQGTPDTLHRRFAMTARQMVQRFGEFVSPRTKALAGDPKKMDTQVSVIHAVYPRDEAGTRGNTNRHAPFCSVYVEEDGKHIIGESGFFEFPYIVYYWLQADESAYGESPAMLALPDILGLNVARKATLQAMQQWVKPPLAVAHDGVMNRPNLNSGATNFGAIDANGRLKIQPILTSQDPSIAMKIIDAERQGVRESLYSNLFQILIQNPQMTATEAMLRANEKGELLGPSGAKIQAALSRMIDREYGILERKGAFERGASLEPPRSVWGKSVGVEFSSPLDRLRQMKEANGIMHAYQAAGQIAAVRGDPSIFDNFDDDKALKIVSEVNGAPMSIMRTSEQVDELRAQRAQAQKAQQAMAAAEQAARTAKDAVPAAQGMQQLAANAQAGPTAPLGPMPLPALAPPTSAVT
jgi:hypothetical protein